MGAFHEAGCWTIWTRCVQNDWWQMPYKYQTWHDWHDDHNGNFPELNGGSKDHIFFLGLTNYTIYIYYVHFFSILVDSIPMMSAIVRGHRVTGHLFVRPTRIKTGKCFHRCSGLRRSQIPWDVPFAPQRVVPTGRATPPEFDLLRDSNECVCMYIYI